MFKVERRNLKENSRVAFRHNGVGGHLEGALRGGGEDRYDLDKALR